MKKLVLVLLLQGFALCTFAQAEPFIKSLRKLEFGSTILDAGMLFKKDYSQFQMLEEKPHFIADIADPKDSTKSYRIEGFYLISMERKQLVQLYYVNNKLYQKGAYWFFEKGEIAEVETKYAKCNNYFKSDPFFISRNHGVVAGTEMTSNLGRKTQYLIDKVDKDVAAGECGYEVVYNKTDGASGFWVYIDGINTLEMELDPSMEVPELEAPKVVMDEVREALLNQSAD